MIRIRSQTILASADAHGQSSGCLRIRRVRKSRTRDGRRHARGRAECVQGGGVIVHAFHHGASAPKGAQNREKPKREKSHFFLSEKRGRARFAEQHSRHTYTPKLGVPTSGAPEHSTPRKLACVDNPNASARAKWWVRHAHSSGACAFGRVRFRARAHSGVCAFGRVRFRARALSGACALGRLRFRARAHSGVCAHNGLNKRCVLSRAFRVFLSSLISSKFDMSFLFTFFEPLDDLI